MSNGSSEKAYTEDIQEAAVASPFVEGMRYEEALALLIQRTSYHTREELIDVLQTKPAAKFKALKPSIRQFLISSLQNNEPLRWSALKALMDDADLSIDDRRIVMNGWIEESLRYMGITREGLKPGVAALKRSGKVPPESHHLLEEIHKAVNNHDSMRLPSLTEAELDDLARNGDTRYMQGTDQRMDIIGYRLQKGLPLEHPNDIRAYIDKD